MKTHSLTLSWLIVGDVIVLLVIAIVGFLNHNEAIDWRVLTTFLPFLAGWALIAPWLGLYRPEVANDPRQVWRAALAAFIAAPMAAWLRGMWLGNQAILPIFVLVLAGTGALGYLAWRLVWAWLAKRFVIYG